MGDNFGDVYGFLLAVTGDGFTYAELEDYVDAMKKELSLIDGVSRVELWGVQPRCIYIDVSQARLTRLGITMEALENTLVQQNLVVDSGGMDFPTERLRIDQTGAFATPEDIGDLVVRGSGAGDIVTSAALVPLAGAGNELLRIRDIATVRRGYVEPPRRRCDTTARRPSGCPSRTCRAPISSSWARPSTSASANWRPFCRSGSRSTRSPGSPTW